MVVELSIEIVRGLIIDIVPDLLPTLKCERGGLGLHSLASVSGITLVLVLSGALKPRLKIAPKYRA
ncbi:MAG: hypothetical protein QXT84_06945 [Candidatus Bathyarchaeia archaeon]